jgi:hypothetical protein
MNRAVVVGVMAHSVHEGMGIARYLQRVHGIEWMSSLLDATGNSQLGVLHVGAALANSS